MAQFDPRRQPLRFAPHVFTAAAAVTVAVLVWRVFQPVPEQTLPPLDPVQMARLEADAFAAMTTRPGLAEPEVTKVRLRAGETLEQAVRRAGVAPAEAAAAARTVTASIDPSAIRAGQSFEAAIARPRQGAGQARLIGLTLRTGPASQVTLSTNWDGAMKLRALEEKVFEERHVAAGKIQGSLWQSAADAGATSALVGRVNKLFAHKLDFQRDIRANDDFVMVFDRKVTESGRTIETGELLYAELSAKGRVTRFYRFQQSGAREAQYFDETGKNIRGFLLRTPVDGARMSSGFGMRRHPILGFARMHQGIDFAAGTGTPVLAAGDGTVVEAKWWGGYGRWVRVRHTGGWETGYAHLSRWAVRPGQRVNQGQVIGYVGSTGRSTGPHLHYEIWQNGRRVNPNGARVPQGTVLSGRDLVAFNAQKAEIDRLIAARKAGRETPRTQVASAQSAALRLAQAAPPAARN